MVTIFKHLCLQGDPVATCMCNRDKVDCTRECNTINVYVVLVLTHEYKLINTLFWVVLVVDEIIKNLAVDTVETEE